MNMSDLDNTPTTKPKCDPLTRVLKRFILIVVCVPAFIGAWVYVSPKSFGLVLINTSKFIRYEILGEQIVRDGTIAQETKEELLDYLESLPKEEKTLRNNLKAISKPPKSLHQAVPYLGVRLLDRTNSNDQSAIISPRFPFSSTR